MRHPPFAAANGIAAVMNFAGIGSIFVLTLYLQYVSGYSALAAGAMLLPLFAPLAALAPVTGRLVGTAGPRPLMLAGLLTGAAGGAALLLVSVHGSYARLLPALFGLGTGMGLLTTAVVAAAMRSCPPARQGLASGTNNTARQAGGAIGVAVLGAIAGSPAHAESFVSGVHVIAILCAALWLAASIVTWLVVPRPDQEAQGAD